MAGRERDRGGVEAIYEGDEVLGALLARAGSTAGAAEVAQRFREAQASGEPRGAVIARLFEREPRFASPDEARRLYGNLFGLWQRVERGASNGAATAAAAPRSPTLPPLPPRGSEPGPELPEALVDGMWRHLDALPPRERRRLRDRYEAAQPDLTAWLEALPLPDVAAVAAQDLAFELWAMLDQAFDDRVRAARFSDLRELERGPPPVAERQPAMAAYVDEVLDLVDEESGALAPEQRQAVARAMEIVVAALAPAS
jgi:hypothetical protein